MKTGRVIAACATLALSAAACGDTPDAATGASLPAPTPAPDDALTAPEANALFDDAVALALAGAPGAAVSREDGVVTLDGTVVLGGGSVSFESLALATRPFAVTGGASIVSEDGVAVLAFANATTGTVTIDGVSTPGVAAFPMTAEFAEGAAQWAVDTAIHPGFASPCPNLAVTNGGNGTFTVDGDCSIGGVATVTIDMVTLDLMALSITGAITVDAAGHTAEILFEGATLDITVDGNLVVDDQPIFAFLG